MEQPNILLTDQVAVVTGGGGGIGRAIALACASVGAHIVIGDIIPERCEETAARVREMGCQALAVPTDVADTNQVRALIDNADRHFKRIDILVNNAGGVSRKPFIEQSERSWRRHIDLNLVSMLAATSAAPLSMSAASRRRAQPPIMLSMLPVRPACSTSREPWHWSSPSTVSASMPSRPTTP